MGKRVKIAGIAMLLQTLKERGVGVNEAGRMTAVSGATMCRILNGQRTPALATAVAIERAFGVPVEAWLPEVKP